MCQMYMMQFNPLSILLPLQMPYVAIKSFAFDIIQQIFIFLILTFCLQLRMEKEKMENFWENKDKWAQLRLYQCEDSQGLCKLQVFRQTKKYILQYLRSRVTKSWRIATIEVHSQDILLHNALRNEWMISDAQK